MHDKLQRTLQKSLLEMTARGGRSMAITRIVHALLLCGPVSWDELLLALSNLCVERFQDHQQKGKKKWIARAKVLHAAMEKERAKRRDPAQQPGSFGTGVK